MTQEQWFRSKSINWNQIPNPRNWGKWLTKSQYNSIATKFVTRNWSNMNQNWNSNCEIINEFMETKSMREYMDMKNHITWESLNRIETERGEKEKLQENE
jgi:hypothetical protein